MPKDAGANARSHGTSGRRALEREAEDILRLTSQHLEPRPPTSGNLGEEEAEEAEDFETEEEILRRAMDESRMERKNIGSSSSNPRPVTSDEDDAEDESLNDNGPPAGRGEDSSAARSASPQFSFPSLPSHTPEDTTEMDPIDPDIDAKMSLLLGLSGPRTAPGPPRLPSPPKDDKRKPGQGWNLPGYKDDRDDDPDSWCCMFISLLLKQMAIS